MTPDKQAASGAQTAPYVDPKFLASDAHALADQVQMQHMTGRVV